MSRWYASLGWAALIAVVSSCGAARQMSSDPVTTDPARVDSLAPATAVELELASAGDRMNGLLYVASGTGPHPTVVLLHGYPGNERNLDLAQAIRRAGMNALFFSYRGAWGSGGTFSFGHALDDVAAVVQRLRIEGDSGKYRIDPRRIALVGHSLGGWIGLMAASADPAISCVGGIDYWNIGADGRSLRTDAAGDTAFSAYAGWISAPGAPLRVAGPRALIDELKARGSAWDVDSVAPRLRGRDILLLSTPANGSHEGTASALRRAGARSVTALVWDTDHLFSSRRIELARTVVQWLQQRCGY